MGEIRSMNPVEKLRATILSAGLCVEDNDNGERICGRHEYRWEQTELVCNGVLNSMDELFAPHRDQYVKELTDNGLKGANE